MIIATNRLKERAEMPLENIPEIVITEEFDEALTRLSRGENLFLTGKAGTGKSTLIRHFLASADRNVVVAAPTGIAALNVDGYTIHRLFSFSPKTTVQYVQSSSYYPRRFANAIKNLEILIIDEASMIRADLFDCLAVALERFGPKPGERFGGVQVVLVGDLYQLPPVVTEGEVEHFSTRYSSPYFFSADRYEREHFSLIELNTVFRQIGDTSLIDILNDVRSGALLEDAQATLNARTDPGFRPPLDEFWLTLAVTNRIAGARNREMLELISEPELKHFGTETGDLDGFDKPTENELTYKVGAQIMLLTNDPMNRWANGTMGKIVAQRIDNDETAVTVQLSDSTRVEVRPHTWEINRPVVENRTLRHETIGTYKQLPFRLAWSITIHKSQGQTLQNLVVDLTGGTFAYGQLYVALSRCTTMDGLVLRKDVLPRDLKVDQRIRRFLNSGGVETGTRGRVYLGICNVGDVGRMWRPRPVEIALVTEAGDEITTLVNPTRDLGDARTAYDISASDVQLAPLLADAWAALAPHLAGRTPVGLNIDQDLGYLDYELKRNGYVMPMPLGIELETSALSADEHTRLRSPRAIDRARALRDIARDRPGANAYGEVFPEADVRTGYLMERGQGADAFRAGGVIPTSRTSEEVLAEHLRAATTRTQLSDSAKTILRKVESMIGQSILGPADEARNRLGIADVLVSGAKVCFTGTAIDADGKQMTRSGMETLAAAHGLEFVKTVTKSKCDALVSAEEGSQSTKARNAHKYDKPIFSAEQFLAWTRGEEILNSTVTELGSGTVTTAVEDPALLVKMARSAPPVATVFPRSARNEDTAEAPFRHDSETTGNVAPSKTEKTAPDLPLPAEPIAPLEEQVETTQAEPCPAAHPNQLAGIILDEASSQQDSHSHEFTKDRQTASDVSKTPETKPGTLSERSKGSRKFHAMMGGIFLFLVVGMLIIGVIWSLLDPGSETWAAVVGISWVAATLLVPVWAIWGIIRWRSARKDRTRDSRFL